MDEKIPVVYMFHNSITGEAYIGSTNDELTRKRTHTRKLINGNHPNKKFQAAFDRDQNFDFVAVEVKDREEAFDLEQAIIDEFSDNKFLLNISRDSRYCNINISEETKEKLRQANIGKIQSEETKEKRRQSMLGKNLGKTHTEETKKYISLIQIGKKLSIEHRQKIGLAGLGRVDKPETTIRRKEAAMKRAVKVNADGVIYDSIREAAQAHGICDSSIRDRVNSESERFQSWHFIK